jgi:hypothetical protein
MEGYKNAHEMHNEEGRKEQGRKVEERTNTCGDLNRKISL